MDRRETRRDARAALALRAPRAITDFVRCRMPDSAFSFFPVVFAFSIFTPAAVAGWPVASCASDEFCVWGFVIRFAGEPRGRGGARRAQSPKRKGQSYTNLQFTHAAPSALFASPSTLSSDHKL